MSVQEAIAGAGVLQSLVQGNKESKAAKSAANAQLEAANKTAAAAEADISKKTARSPDIAAISDKNKLGMAEGGQTMLTGSLGVPSSSLRIMQKSLLGQ